MDLTSPTIIKELLARHQARPSKGMGQNFLIEKSVLTKIIEAADINKEDTVIEIGPGLGTLTQELAKKAKKVIAIEKDSAMVEILKETLRNFSNVEVIHANILKLDPNPYTLAPYKLVSNIPYYITSPIIRLFLEAPIPPEAIVLMVQKEVAQRICAVPPNMSILAVSVQFYAKPSIMFYVPKGCFWPSPSVDSAVIKILPLKTKKSIPVQAFFDVVKAGFAAPRKQLVNNVSTGLKKDKKETTAWLLKNNINPSRRAETLTIEEWLRLADTQ